VDVNIIAKSIKVSSEYEWCIHEGTWVNKFALLSDLHLLDVEYKASIEDLLSEGALASKYENLIISDLVG
jgi:hypothetical protein